MNIYTPDKWVVLKINDGEETINKVFAGWYGDYTGSDQWRLNSGNIKEVEFYDRWEFHGDSGSKYVCYKSFYGMNNYMRDVLKGFQNNLTGDYNINIINKSKYIKGD